MKRNRQEWLRFTAGTVGLCLTLLLSPGPFERGAGAKEDADHEAIAARVATLLRSARKVISDNQKLINDPDAADKGLTGEKVVALARQNYKEATGRELGASGPGTLEGKLMKAVVDSVREVMDKAQPLINRQGLGFKGFIPAAFAKQVADAFRKNAAGLADLKVTAPRGYVRNRASAPDPWEDQVMETRFKGHDWTKGKSYTEVAEHKGQRAFRLISPEYYAASCLSCHGEPRGQLDITGGKKEGAKEGDLGGAISVVIYTQ
jgi:hypothetical protein